MIIGTGLDIIDVDRVRAIHKRWGDRFLSKFLSDIEKEYFRVTADPAPGVAARFAAKEAVSKALGTGIGGRVGWHDIEIANESSGRPTVTLHAGALEVLRELGGHQVLISLSHSQGQAAAMAVIEG
jgi:holo-[acyl-carrier protein] synthase